MSVAPLATMETLDWDLFVERYWDREPVLISAMPAPPFEAGEVFQAAVSGTRSAAPHVRAPNTQFSIGRHQQIEPANWLPDQSDASFAGYEKRMAEQLGGRRYALVVHVLHAFHAAQWSREQAFYAGLWERVGLPLTGAITTLFHGNYEHSPVGVHLDRFATFMYALSGRKRMRFWAQRPWSGPVATVLDYEPYLGSSFTAEVRPGQLLYWPASYYHVGESDFGGQPATSVNVGVPRHGHRASYDIEDFLYEATPESVMTRAVDPTQFPPLDPAGLLAAAAGSDLDEQLPPALARALAALVDHGAEESVAERSVVLSLRRWTGGGFHPAPPPVPPHRLTGGDIVRAVAPILWAKGGNVRLCAANGHVTRTRLPADHVDRLVARLRSGVPLPVVDTTGDERRLLETMESFRALERH